MQRLCFKPFGAKSVYIATSLNGCISDKVDVLDWLDSIPNPDKITMGFGHLMDRVDPIVMGQKTRPLRAISLYPGVSTPAASIEIRHVSHTSIRIAS